MQPIKTTILTLALLAACGGTASADIIGFDVSVDTGSLAGTSGGIYLAFSPGFNADPASVSITGFTPLAGLPGGPAFTDGGVSGTLDTGDLVFTNYLYALNDYGEAVTFGATLSFRASFDLPGTLTGQSGSELDVQLTESNLLTPLLTSDPSGNIAEISYDYTGAFTETSTSQYATITPVNGVPEPAMASILAVLAVVFAGIRLVRMRRCEAAQAQA
jgi:hypothetical protein